jgi:2-polyprenyl-3-methyl-5-hydroxy-6-metoxy-1,4-benzoquinol methylase
MTFKEQIYQNYVKNHTAQLYGQESLVSIQKSFPVWRHYFRDLLPKDKFAKILDIGCGNGSFVYFLTESGYKLTSGIDISLQQIESGNSLGIKGISCADLHSFLKDKSLAYDCIIARDVLEHLTKQEIFDTLTSIHSALRPGGNFIMQSPNGQGIFYTSVFYGDFTHEIAFTESSFKQICRSTGFENITCYPTGPVPKGFVSFIRYVLWKFIVLKTRIIKMIETGDSSGVFTQNIIGNAIKP